MIRTALLLLLAGAVVLCPQVRVELNDGEAHGDPPFLLEDGWRPLFNGRDLTGWHTQDGKSGTWLTTSGIRWERLLGPTRLGVVPGSGDRMLNGPDGRTANLVTDEKLGDVELYLEFMVPKGSNSGVYLQGLYEIQVFDSYGSTEPMKTSDTLCGAL